MGYCNLDIHMKSFIRSSLEETRDTLNKAIVDDGLLTVLEAVARLCIEALSRGNKLLLAGNGGSAADAQHIAAELVSRFYYDRPGLPAVALTTDTSALLAIGNDYGFERVFSRQVEALAREGDVFVGISTSGNSPNILAGFAEAKKRGVATVGFSGGNGGKMKDGCDHLVLAPSALTPRIQECHIAFGHILCQLIEDTLYGATHDPKRKA
jgi:D-sedoheptulose 7-phosphate isomerase